MPWPKPTVIVTTSFQFAAGGTMGSPASGSSMPHAGEHAHVAQPRALPLRPTVCAICAAPRLEE